MSAIRWFLFVQAACTPERSPAFRDSLESTDPPLERSVEGSRVLFATNRTHVLRATFEPDGVVVSGATGPAADIHMSLHSWGREGALAPGEWVAPSDGARRTHYVRDGLIEWWESRSEGLEHGFTVMSRPPGDGLLVFEVTVDGAFVTVEEGDSTAATLSRPGAPNLSYNDLAAWDESGRSLPAWMEETDDGLRLVVDDTEALGTVTVDPLLTSATATMPIGWRART